MEHGPAKERCPGCDWKWTTELRNRPRHTCEEHSPDKQVLRVLREHGSKCPNRQDLYKLVARSVDTIGSTDAAAHSAIGRALGSPFATDADRKIYADLKTPDALRSGATAAQRSAFSRAAATKKDDVFSVALAEAKAARARDATRRAKLPSEEDTARMLTKEFKQATAATYAYVNELLRAIVECACVLATARGAADEKLGGALELCLAAEESMGAHLLPEGGFGFVTEALQKKAQKMIEDEEDVDAESLKLEAEDEREKAAEEARAAARRRPPRKAKKVEKVVLKAQASHPGTFVCAFNSGTSARRREFMLGADAKALDSALKTKDKWGRDGTSAEVFANAAEQYKRFQATGRAFIVPADLSSREYEDLKPTLTTEGRHLRLFKCVARLGHGHYLILLLRSDGRRPMLVITTRALLADLLIGVAPDEITDADADARLRHFAGVEKALKHHLFYLGRSRRAFGALASVVTEAGLTAEEMAPALVGLVKSLRGRGDALALNAPPHSGNVSSSDDEDAPAPADDDDAADQNSFGRFNALAALAAELVPHVSRGVQIKESSTPSSRRGSRDDVASMASGARNLISTQVRKLKAAAPGDRCGPKPPKKAKIAAPTNAPPPPDPQAMPAPPAPQQQGAGAAAAPAPAPVPRGFLGDADNQVTFAALDWDWALKAPAAVDGAPEPLGEEDTLVKFYSRAGPAFAKAAGQNLKVLVPKSTVDATVRDDIVKAIAGAVDTSTAA